ncbi:hypothetical protein LX73_0294 [Fodinibius salinus]|uniref:Uncharacterized protein n=1 Tax=Fodinibius salinus TaxID=860790 RepID=A0A5D3YM74_9BACT|nr:hypothetical protein LX73_0294 [Fodinibius salinus]
MRLFGFGEIAVLFFYTNPIFWAGIKINDIANA